MIEFLNILFKTVIKGIIPGSIVIVYKGNLKNRKFLLTKAKHSNKITFPSGSIGWGENYKDAAIRELQEETGIKADEVVEVPITHSFRYKNIIFKPRAEQHVFVYKVEPKEVKLFSKETIWFGWKSEEETKKLISHKELVSTFRKVLKLL